MRIAIRLQTVAVCVTAYLAWHACSGTSPSQGGSGGNTATTVTGGASGGAGMTGGSTGAGGAGPTAGSGGASGTGGATGAGGAVDTGDTTAPQDASAVSDVADAGCDSSVSTDPAKPVDILVFGDATSEQKHSLAGTSTETITGALNEPARRCLPLSPADYYGGTMAFSMAVDPTRRNYFTVKLWSGDDTDSAKGRIYLYIPVDRTDYQVGFRHEGDYMPLSVANYRQGSPGRFFYSTTLLPLSMTQGKTSIRLKIVSTGRLYPLGSGGEKDGGNYQFLMKVTSRGLYRAYTHVDPYLDPAGEVLGSKPTVGTRPSPGAEVLAKGGTFEKLLTSRITALLNAPADTTFSSGSLAYLARAYSVAELPISYQSAAIVDKVIKVADAYAVAFYDGNLSASSGWGGSFGPIGQAIQLLSDPLAARLDDTADYGGGGNVKRRKAWGDLLYASRESGRMNRQRFTNQDLISNESIYMANRGMLAVGDSRAFPEADARRYLREASGMSPWLGNDTATGGHDAIYGSSYYQVTTKGLTREWGYVGKGYGEMAFYPAAFYAATKDAAFLTQAVKMAKARAPFRRPGIEIDGSSAYRSMEAVGLLAWRAADESDGEFGDAIAYAGKADFADALRVAGATLDPTLVGYAKQMLEDNQYFVALTSATNAGDIRALEVFDDYAAIASAPDSGVRLPMTDGQPDFAWADEENGIVAIKHGNERLWVSAFWQARSGINGVGRFEYDTETHTQYGVLETVPRFVIRGSYTRPMDLIDNMGDFQWTPPDPRPLQAYGGETLPLAKLPPAATDDSPSRGRADFYALRLGHFLVGINGSDDTAYPLMTPNGFSSAPELVSGKALSGPISVASKSTVALYLPDPVDASPVPMAPLFLNVANGSAGVDLSWTTASGATAYTVKRAESPGGPYTPTATNVTKSSYTDVTPTVGRTYYYVVAATNANGESYPSCERAVTAAIGKNVISFNFTPSVAAGMSADLVAGVPGARVGNWNNFTGGALSAGIVDGAGQSVTGLSVSLTTGSALSDRGGASGDDLSMFRTVLDQTTSSSTLTAADVPFPAYDVYFYIRADENSPGANDRGGSITIGGQTYYVRTGSATAMSATDGTGYVQATSTSFGSGMDVGLGNYIRFTGLGGDLAAKIVAVDINGGAQRLKLAGFQIVKR